MKLLRGDILSFARHYQGEKFHALLTDPPYHLTSITKRFGKDGSAPAQYGKDGAFSRASAGFMGKQWDGGDLAFDPATWAVLGELLYPGAFGMAFASSRGWHRLAVAIEDAGFIIHPSIFGWGFGSGFPKATRIDTQVDKAVGAERDQEWYDRYHDGGTRQNLGKEHFHPSSYNPSSNGNVRSIPSTPLARAWEDHRYGLQALKPALEPIIVFQKPYEGRPVDDITRTGAGALNIEGGRVGTQDNLSGGTYGGIFGTGAPASKPEIGTGRWPANLIILDTDAATALDKQSGEQKDGVAVGGYKTASSIYGNYPDNKRDAPNVGYGSSGGASRFFYNVQRQLDEAEPLHYCAKASPAERDAGLGGMPLQKRMSQGRDIVTFADRKDGRGRVPVNWRLQPKHNIHPTLKPLDLCRYLATLLLPPPEYAPRRIFVPFAGTASEMIGAHMAGWECIVGVEKETEYVEIGRARMRYWSGEKQMDEWLNGKPADSNLDNLPLFAERE